MKPEYQQIHKAIHNPKATAIRINGVNYPVRTYTNKCRFVVYDGITFMEQNKDKTKNGKLTPHALRARNGEKITWGIKEGDWIFIGEKPK